MATKVSAGKRVLMIVENLPVPFDRRVWQEALALRDAGYSVSVICPAMKGFERPDETLEGIRVLRHRLPLEARGALGYVAEYSAALFWQTLLSWRIALSDGFDAIHACNPPDTIFLVAAPFKLLGKRFLFDHHDICPELFEAKFGKRGPLYWVVRTWERLTFALADVSIATNNSYREIAIQRGRMAPERVFVVRSGPDLRRLHPVDPDPSLKNGRRYLVGYLGTMGKQEGMSYLLRAIAEIVHVRGRTDIQFAIVGGGPELEALKTEAWDQGIGEYVTFTGRIPDAEMVKVLSTADLCVNPDEHNPMNDKSTMNKVIEYMALRKPIIQFDLTEGRVSAEESSAYVEPNDSHALASGILELLADEPRRRRMGEVGRRRVEEALAWQHQIPHLLRAYEALFAD